MKTGLTQRGWNNVLIFASLFMIVLFNSTHQRFISNESNKVTRSLIESESLLQNIDFNGLKFERIGTGWRTVTELKLDEELSPKNVITHWVSNKVEVLSAEPAMSKDFVRFPVAVDVIGINRTQIFEFIIDSTSGLVYIFDHSLTQWMIIEQAQLPVYIPSVLLNINN